MKLFMTPSVVLVTFLLAAGCSRKDATPPAGPDRGAIPRQPERPTRTPATSGGSDPTLKPTVRPQDSTPNPEQLAARKAAEELKVAKAAFAKVKG